MSYDFSFRRLVPRPPHFPFKPTLEGPWTCPPLRQLTAINELFASDERFRANGVVGETLTYRLENKSGGCLYVFATETSIALGVHAKWSLVLALYELLLPFEQELLIADNQTAIFYDAPAFRSFIDESAQRKADLVGKS